MEDKTKIETTPTSIYQQPLENNRKIKTALTIDNNGNKTAFTTKQQINKQHQQVLNNSHYKTTEK